MVSVAICHGPQIMINAGIVKDQKMTSAEAISRDLINAGADWVDEEGVVDEGLVAGYLAKPLWRYRNGRQLREGRIG